MITILNFAGCIFTFLFGVWAILQPLKAARLVSLTPYKELGITEIRATYGGWMCGLSGFVLFMQSPILFQCLGFGWFGAGIVRTFSMFLLDKSYSKQNTTFVIFEFIIGLFLVL